MKKKICCCMTMVLLIGFVFAVSTVGAQVLYEQNFDDLEMLGTPPGFQALAELIREPSLIAIDEYALTGSQFEFFDDQTEEFTMQFLLAVTEEPTPDSTGPEVLLRGRATGSEQPGVQMSWGEVHNGIPAYYDGVDWVSVGDIDLDGELTENDTPPAPLPISTPEDPQWVPVQLVIHPADGLYEYWQGEPNDLEFETLEMYQSDLFMPLVQPVMTSYLINTPGDTTFVDEVEIFNEATTIVEEDFETQATRDNTTIALDSQSMMLLQNIDNGVATFEPVEENFTIRYFMAVTTQGQKNQRAAQLLINGPAGIGPQLAWGNLDPGLANYYDGTAWRQVGDENQDGVEDETETWPPALETTDASDPASANWIPIQIDVNMDNGTFNYYQGEPNDFEFATLQQYGGDLLMRNALLSSTSVNFQNSQRGGGHFWIDNFILNTASGDTVINEDFEGDWAVEEPLLSGGVLEEEFTVGSQSLRVRPGEDTITVDIPDTSGQITFDFLLAISVPGESGSRAARLHINGDGGTGPQISWGEIEGGRSNFYNGSQWVIVGDANADGSENGDETWVPEMSTMSWTPIRIVTDTETDSFDFWQGPAGDTTFDNVKLIHEDATFRFDLNEITVVNFPFGDRAGGDFYLDNINFYVGDGTSVNEWSLY